MATTQKPGYPLRSQVAVLALRASEPLKGARCLEIGPGDSRLTRRLMRRKCEVVALGPKASDEVGSSLPNVTILDADVLKTTPSTLGRFDRVFVSLVSLYFTAAELRKMWRLIGRVTKPTARVVSVDLHPCSKSQGHIPWRDVTTPPNDYWDSRTVRASIANAKDKQTTAYRHHTLDQLARGPLDQNFRLIELLEFPRRWNSAGLSAPAYLLTVWSRD